MTVRGMKMYFANNGKPYVWCLLLCLACGPSTEPRDRLGQIWEIYYHHPETVLVVAHRGAHTEVPENSLASIDKAVEAGAHIVELDVRRTQDGVFVIMHDRTLDRTTTGSGEVANHTYAELQSLRLLYHGDPTEHPIP